MIEKTELADAEPDPRSAPAKQATCVFIRVISDPWLVLLVPALQSWAFCTLYGNSEILQLAFGLSTSTISYQLSTTPFAALCTTLQRFRASAPAPTSGGIIRFLRVRPKLTKSE